MSFREPKYTYYFKIKTSTFSKSIAYKIVLYNDSIFATFHRIHTSFDGETTDDIDDLEFKYDDIKTCK